MLVGAVCCYICCTLSKLSLSAVLQQEKLGEEGACFYQKLFMRYFSWIKKIVIANIVNSIICYCAIAQDSDQIPFSKIGPLSLDSNTVWLQKIFDTSVSDNVQMLGLGEVSHGGYEPLALKAKMIQYLVEERGYRNIVLEFPDMAALLQVRRYLLNDSIKDVAVADSFAKATAGLPNAQEVFALLFRWLKLYNLAHPNAKVRLTGFDFSNDVAAQNFFLYNYIIPFDHKYAEGMLYYWNNKAMSDSAKMASVNGWFNANRDRLVKAVKKEEFEELQYQLQNETNSIDFAVFKFNWSNNDPFAVIKYRDSIMANNVIKLANGQKTIVWAHNAHISTSDGYMGKRLKEQFKSQYFILLTDFSNEANVYVKLADGQLEEQHFTSGRRTIAYNLLNNYRIPEGIFLNRLPSLKVYDEINFIDINGKNLVYPTGDAFDVLVIFNNIAPSLKSATTR